MGIYIASKTSSSTLLSIKIKRPVRYSSPADICWHLLTSADVSRCPEKLGFRRYNQELQFGKGLYLVDQYLSKVCGKNYLNDGSVKGWTVVWKNIADVGRCRGQPDVGRCHRKLGFSKVSEFWVHNGIVTIIKAASREEFKKRIWI